MPRKEMGNPAALYAESRMADAAKWQLWGKGREKGYYCSFPNSLLYGRFIGISVR